LRAFGVVVFKKKSLFVRIYRKAESVFAAGISIRQARDWKWLSLSRPGALPFLSLSVSFFRRRFPPLGCSGMVPPTYALQEKAESKASAAL
jgi:hypothetical protein